MAQVHTRTLPDDYDLCIQGLNLPEQADVKDHCEVFLKDILSGSQIEKEVAYLGHEITQRGSERELFVSAYIHFVILTGTKTSRSWNCSSMAQDRSQTQIKLQSINFVVSYSLEKHRA